MPTFVDVSNLAGSIQNGSLQYPYGSVTETALDGPVGTIVWIKGGTYTASGTYNNPSTWKNYPGSGMATLGG